MDQLFAKILNNKKLRPPEVIEDHLAALSKWYPQIEAYDEEAYARHTVFATDETNEVVLVCWKKDQKTPIHNHAGQSCWVYVLKGVLRQNLISNKTLEALPENSPSVLGQETWTEHLKACELLNLKLRHDLEDQEVVDQTVAGQWCYIDDSLGVHSMHALTEVVSLHFYRSLDEK